MDRRRWRLRTRTSLASLWLVLGLACGCAMAVARADEPRATVVLVSLDGTRPADLTTKNLPSLVGLAARGARAERLVPVSPSNTFPSHVSLVTGVSPARHGIVNNSFRDPVKGVFDKQNAADWLESEPLWSILEGHGIATAAYHWVGSEGAAPGFRAPRHWLPFSKSTREKEKVEQILAWLDLPESEGRPRFIASWFRGADHAGHDHGPGSDAVHRALIEQDPAIRALAEGIEARGLLATTTLIVVSDHGMAAAERRIDLGARLGEQGIRAHVFGIGGFASVDLGRTGSADPQLAKRTIALCEGLGLAAEPGSGLGNPRFADLVVRAPMGTAIVYRGLFVEGFHGYDPNSPEMAAILVAWGRGVAPGSLLPAVRAIDVAPTVLQLLGVATPDGMEGRAIAGIGSAVEEP